MRTRHVVRLGLALAALLLVLLLASSIMSASGNVYDRYEDQTATVDARSDITVVTTSPRRSGDASLVAFAPNGSVLYYNETYDYYFDVDHVEGTEATVEYAAVKRFEEPCALESRLTHSHACSQNVIERVNLTTGETTQLYSYRFRPVDIGGWHDADRVDESRLLVAGSVNDRVFIVNTNTDVVEWQWSAQSQFDLDEGGRFPSDWSHINDVEHLDDGRIMVSMRNQDQVVFIDPEDGVQEDWTLGEDDAHDVLYEQHNPDFIPAEHGGPAVLVADSETNRVVEYQRTDSGSWEQSWEWQDLDLQWPRDADRLPNGHTLITDSNGNRVLEIDENGSVVWEVAMDTPYEAERLGTGDESSGGQSAEQLGLDARSETEPNADSESDEAAGFSGKSVTIQIVKFVKNHLPPIILNGVMFILPPWFSHLELLATVGLIGILGVWGVLEYRWSRYRLSLPIRKR